MLRHQILHFTDCASKINLGSKWTFTNSGWRHNKYTSRTYQWERGTGEGSGQDLKMVHLIHCSDTLPRDCSFRPVQTWSSPEIFLSTTTTENVTISQKLVSQWNQLHKTRGLPWSKSTITYSAFRTICSGRGPKTLSIIAKCSKFSCVWNNASPWNKIFHGFRNFENFHGPSSNWGLKLKREREKKNQPSKVRQVYSQCSTNHMDKSILVLQQIFISWVRTSEPRSPKPLKPFNVKSQSYFPTNSSDDHYEDCILYGYNKFSFH